MPAAERQAAIDELDREIKILTRRRAVLSGELYTLRGRFKAMGRDYGFPFMVWWTVVWLATGCGIFAAISVRVPAQDASLVNEWCTDPTKQSADTSPCCWRCSLQCSMEK